METFSALLALCAGNSPDPGEVPAQSQWRGGLMFSLIYVWIKGWVNNGETLSHPLWSHFNATCTDPIGNNVRWSVWSFWQKVCKWHGCHFIEMGYGSQHMMYLENRDFGILYDLLESNMRLFMQGCDKNKKITVPHIFRGFCGAL